MIITRPGTYTLLHDYHISIPNSTGAILKRGTDIEITQVDHECGNVIGPQFYDWEYWNLPAEEKHE